MIARRSSGFGLRTTALVLVILSSPGSALAAQEEAPRPGSRVRLTYPCGPSGRGAAETCRVAGELVSLREDTITVATAETTTSVGRTAISRLEVSRGQRSHRWVGAGAGFVVGAGATWLVLHSGGSTALCDRSANQDAMAGGECAGLTVLGGLAGAGLGYLVGALIRAERWQDMPVDRLRLGVVRRPGGAFGLAVTVPFTRTDP